MHTTPTALKAAPFAPIADDLFDLLSPSPFADILATVAKVTPTTDPFTPSLVETAAALNEDGDGFFDVLDFSPFANDDHALSTEGEWPCCLYHGFHEAEDDGEPLCYCTRCERRA